MLNPDQEAVQQQLQQLHIHRRTLAHYIAQEAKLTPQYTPPGVANGIWDEREAIRQIKITLRAWGISVDDLPNDIAPTIPDPSVQQPANQSSASNLNNTNLQQVLNMSVRSPANLPLPKMRAADYQACFTIRADDEAQELSSFFVAHTLFRAMLGNPTSPESIIVFGKDGHGKTSHCLEIQKACRPMALPVLLNYSDIAQLARIAPMTEETYLQLIRERTLEALRHELRNSRRRKLLQASPQALIDLEAAEYLSGLRTAPPVPSPPLAQAMFTLSRQNTRGWLQTLSGSIVKGASFKSVYVLLDGVTDRTIEEYQPATIVNQMLPLFMKVVGLYGCGFAFKCFLPVSLRTYFAAAGVNWRSVFSSAYELEWNEQHLREMLSRRLLTFHSRTGENSRRTPVERFADLCELDIDIDIDAALARAADGSPRQMLKLARTIIETHCAREPFADHISLATIRSVLR